MHLLHLYQFAITAPDPGLLSAMGDGNHAQPFLPVRMARGRRKRLGDSAESQIRLSLNELLFAPAVLY